MKCLDLIANLGVTSALILVFGFSSAFSANAADAANAADEDEEMEEIVVYGTRSATQASLAIQKAKDNISTVLSSDITGRFSDSTLAETMRRAPGISFQRSESGGEGQYVSIRGLDTGLNNIKINGVTSAAASGSRRVSFDYMQAEMMSEIVINKSLLPQHDGEGIGGAIELNVRNPLSYSEDQISFRVEGRYGEFREKTGPSGSFNFNRALGDNLAISGYISYRKRYVETHQYNIEGDHLPANIGFFEDAADPGDLMDRAPGSSGSESQNGWARIYGPLYTAQDFPGGFNNFVIEDFKYNFNQWDKTDRAYTFNVGWRPTDDTELIFAFTYADSYRDNLRMAYAFYQSDKYAVPSGCFVCDGETYDGPLTGAFYGTSPQINIKGEVNDYYRDNGSATVKVTTDISDSLRVTYGGGYTTAMLSFDGENDINYRIDDLEKEFPSDFGGQTLVQKQSEFNDNNKFYIAFDETGGDYSIPIPLLTDAGWAAIVDPNMPEFYYATISPGWREGNDRSVVYADVHKLFDGGGLVSDIQVGFKVERSEFFDRFYDLSGGGYWEGCCLPDGTWGGGSDTGVEGVFGNSGKHRLSEGNLVSGNLVSLSQTNTPIPKMTHFMDFSRNAIIAFGDRFRATRGVHHTGYSTLQTREDLYGAYFQVGLDFGEDVHVIAGVRVERVEADVSYRYDNIDAALVALGAPLNYKSGTTGGYTDILPRVQLNYRPTDKIVVRVALSSAVARPVLRDMGVNRVDLGETRNDEGIATGESTLNVRLANPDLETAYSSSADLMVEYFTESGGIFGVGVYYKRIKNFIYRYTAASSEASGSIADIKGFENLDISGFDQVNYEKRENGDVANILGFEFNLIYSFEDVLPGIWSGLGVYANATLQKSDADIVASTYPYLVKRNVDFHNSPRKIANFAITYEKYGIDATLSYAFQDWQMDTVEDFMNQDEWEAPFYTVDVNLEYTLPIEFAGGEHMVFFKLSDLTNTDGDRAINQETHGKHRRWLDDAEFIGRQFIFGFRSRF